jgi:8-oxo-dGTP pyrophosphatase MutT (NUDIX family)
LRRKSYDGAAMNEAVTVIHLDRLEFTFAPKLWAFATERRAEIDAHFAALQRERPTLWNGRVLVMHHRAIANGVLNGSYLETDYASFAAWCDWGRPPAGAYDCFATAAIKSADGAFLLGVMGAHTLNAGRIYFPCGTPDRSDIVNGKVDLDFSVRRELKEETGFDISEFTVEPGWTTVIDGALIANFKVLRSGENAETLRTRIQRYIAGEQQPEFVDIRIVRGPADIVPAMPRFVTAFLAQRLAVL